MEWKGMKAGKRNGRKDRQRNMEMKSKYGRNEEAKEYQKNWRR